ncbi:hypothetical protein JCM10207_005680 [Rhodosporidiobolus poonsookiae]
MPPTPRVLVSGAGIAGTVASYWLGRLGVRSTVVEAASSMRTNGQTLDINGVARDVVRKMGLMDEVLANCTKEEGAHVVDDSKRILARLPVGRGPTNDTEILRYKLSTVFYNASKAKGEYRFGDSIAAIDETPDGARVTFRSGLKETYDAVLLADGMHSRTRDLILSPSEVTYNSLNAYVAYFSLPLLSTDDTWSKLWWSTDRRVLWLRPVPDPRTMLACFITTSPRALAAFADYRSLDPAEQRQRWADLYRGAGWETERVLAGLEKADDFYMHEVAQVKLASYSKGRVAVVGDAAYCPSPMSGMGTSCAITGAYVLAGELASRLKDVDGGGASASAVKDAFAAYERICRPYVQNAAEGAPGPWIRRAMMPESRLGVFALQKVISAVGVVVNSRLLDGYNASEREEDEKIELPHYS